MTELKKLELDVSYNSPLITGQCGAQTVSFPQSHSKLQKKIY